MDSRAPLLLLILPLALLQNACSAPVPRPPGFPAAARTPPSAARLEPLARSNQLAFLEFCLQHYQSRYHDYSCTYRKQEVVHGISKPLQEIQAKFMNSPFSVCLTWTKNPLGGDKLLYVEGLYHNQMLIRPTEKWIQTIVPTAVRAPDDPQVMANSLRPVTLFGFARNLKTMIALARQAQADSDLAQSFGGYATLGDRTAFVLICEFPRKSAYRTAGAKVFLYIDTEYLVPIGIYATDWSGQFLYSYEYSNIHFNVGLTSRDFLPEPNGLQTPPDNP